MAHVQVTSTETVRTRWETTLAEVAAAFRMNAEERQRFCSKPIARLIAALPHLAGCDRANRISAEHLGVYVLSVRETRHLFFATPDDDRDVFARLHPIMRFHGGDPRILDRGMALIALTMVLDYARDVEVDRAVGKYNPVAAGAWDADAIIANLRDRIRSVDCPEMDAIMDAEDDVENWWQWE